MFKALLKRGMAQDLALILGSAVAPKDMSNLKSMRALLKISDKCEVEAEDVKQEQEKLDAALKVFRTKLSEATTEDEKKALNQEATETAQPFVDRMNELREKECEVEFSDDQIELLRNEFFKLIAQNLKSARYALEIAQALEVPDAKE